MRKRLEKKGWNPKHIDHAEAILKKAQAKKHPEIKKVETSMFWFTLIISILGTGIISVAIIPILVIANDFWSYIIIGVFGFLLGFLIAYIANRMTWLQKYHKISLTTIAPIIGLVNLFFISTVVNEFNTYIKLNNYHDPILIGLIYFASFMLPNIMLGGMKK